jgi:hypothetical protein
VPTIHRTASRFVVATTTIALVLTAGAALVAPSAASAAPVFHDEQVGGDLTNSRPPFTFDARRNTFTGTVSVASATNVFDFDSFGFIVPAGLQVEAAAVVLTDVAGNITLARWTVNAGRTLPGWGTPVEAQTVPSPGAGTFAAMPLPAGQYNFWNDAVGVSNAVPGVAAYTIVFDVSPVPEPATLATIACAAAPLLLSHRRR